MFKVRILGIDQIQKDLKDLARQKPKQGLDSAGGFILGQIKKKAPVDTGAYRKSWKKGRNDGKSIILETPKGLLYEILEFQGSRPHDIYPRRAKVLHWIDKETGQDRFAMHVKHPGFEPIPHVRPVLKKDLDRAATIILKAMTKKSMVVSVNG